MITVSATILLFKYRRSECRFYLLRYSISLRTLSFHSMGDVSFVAVLFLLSLGRV